MFTTETQMVVSESMSLYSHVKIIFSFYAAFELLFFMGIIIDTASGFSLDARFQ